MLVLVLVLDPGMLELDPEMLDPEPWSPELMAIG